MLSRVAACCPVMVAILNDCNNKALLLLGLCRLVLYAYNCPLATSCSPAGIVARGSPTHPFPSLLLFPSHHCIPFHSLPCPFSPPRNDPKPMQSRTLWSAVSSPSEVRGTAPTANAFRYILSRWNVSLVATILVVFRVNQNVVTEVNLAFTFPGALVPRFPCLRRPRLAWDTVID